ncbi:MAG: hypothetical protein GDA52_04285 [Rhodobacteraceae bacterium]|nr:hypothetical protein [Paracoccaceae bacterium]
MRGRIFLDSGDLLPVYTHATFRFALSRFGCAAFDDCLIVGTMAPQSGPASQPP